MITDKNEIQRIKELLFTEKETLRIEGIEDYFTKIINRAEFTCLKIGDRIEGFVAYYCNDVFTRHAYITMVVINRSYRNKGLGKILVSRVLEELKIKGFESCGLEVDTVNVWAYHMYIGVGFFSKDWTEKEKIKMEVIL